MKTDVELYEDARCSLGEGAIWDDCNRLLYWVDINSAELFATDPGTGTTVQRYLSGSLGTKIGTVVPRRSGGLAVAFEDRLASYDWETEALEPLVELESDNHENRSNDGKCDPRGRLWVGSLCPESNPGSASLYRIDAELSVHRMLSGITVSNGIVWNRDLTLMYYIDTPTARIDVFDYDDETGSIGGRRVCVEVPGEMGLPDGMTIDEEGYLWVALFYGGRVACWNPDDGRLVAKIKLPVSNVTSCAFGGVNRDVLFITTARLGLPEADLSAQPQAGGLFAAQPGVRGTETYRFSG
jgi:sugar lactone lactonase YvrE